METSDLVRLKQLEAENAQMQRIIARQMIEIDAMKNLVSKNGWGPRGDKKRWGLCTQMACRNAAHVALLIARVVRGTIANVVR